jgi:hypothetical protein
MPSANAIGYAEHRSRSHDAVIRVYDSAGNVDRNAPSEWAALAGKAKIGRSAFSFSAGPLLREWRARKKILRRHRRDSGLAVSIELGRSRTGYAIFIIRRIGKPEDHVVQISTEPGNVVKCKSLLDDGIHADVRSARRIRGEIPDLLNRAEGRHRHFGQEERKGRIGRQVVGCLSGRWANPNRNGGRSKSSPINFFTFQSDET